MEENVLQRNISNEHLINKMNQMTANAHRPEPRQVIAKGIELSTGITDKNKVAELTDRAVKGDRAAKNGNYDIFLFGIAESLEKIKCETSSINEYFEWMDDAQHIMDNMTDGFVTPEDLAEKNNFIANSWQREAEILICLGLYERSNNPLAAQRVSEMTMKLKRLRQLRSALVNNTKNKPDKEPLTAKEKERMAALAMVLRKMRYADKEGDHDNVEVSKELEAFQASHANDMEFYRGYSFYTRMLDDQRMIDLQKLRVRTMDSAERLDKLHHPEESKEDVRNMILRLTGRKMNNQNNVSVQNQNTQNYLHSHHEQAFDAERFRRIRMMKDREFEED